MIKVQILQFRAKFQEHITCILRWNGMETVVSTSFQRRIHVVWWRKLIPINNPKWLKTLITWLSEICLTSLIALFWNFLLLWNFPPMICNFPLVFSNSGNIRMSTLITIIIAYWLLIIIIIIIGKSNNNYLV